MAQETIRVGTIKAVSPTLAETLRQCKLRAGMSRAEEGTDQIRAEIHAKARAA